MKKYELYFKKYKKLIPSLIYPFVVAFLLLFIYFFQDNALYELIMGKGMDITFFCIEIIFPLVGLICNLRISNQIKKEKWDYLELLEVNMLIKCVQIPAYIVIFLFGLTFLLTIIIAAFSIMLVMFDCFAVILSGMVACTAIKRTVSEGALNKRIGFLCKIGSFIFCLDVIVAIVLYIMGRDKAKKNDVKILSEKSSCEI